MSKLLAAHQPNFLPYLGFFEKLRRSDLFVIRDEVLFIERDFHHRNRIRVNGEDNENDPQFSWIGVPVTKKRDYLRWIQIKMDAMKGKRHWKEEMAHQLRVSYGHTPYFDKHFDGLIDIVNNSSDSLVELNIDLTKYIARAFGINTPLIMASSLGLRPGNYTHKDPTPSEDIVAICEAVGANKYLSGNGATSYMKMEPFEKAGIEVMFQDFTHPVYAQSFKGFLPNMSAIDALFCVGEFPYSKHQNGITSRVA